MQYSEKEPLRHAGGVLLPAVREYEVSPGTLPALTGYRPENEPSDAVPEHANAWNRLVNCVISMAAREISHGGAFLFVPVFLALGASIWFALDTTPSTLAVSVAFAGALLASLLTRYRQTVTAFSVRAILLTLAGMLLADIETMRHATVMLDTPVTTVVTGKVERRERDGRGYWRYVIAVEKTENPVVTRPPQRVALLARSRHAEIPAGDYITGRARLSPPSGPALPGLNDFAMGSYFAGIGATGYFYGAPSHAVREAGAEDAGNWLYQADAFLYRLRSAIAARIRDIVPGDAGAFSASIITDERRAISAGVVEALRVSGLAHIVAISGLNMALAGGIFFVGLRMILSLFPAFSQAIPTKKIAAFAALLMVTAYYLVSGFAVSAERAWLMMSIMLIAVLFDRPSISMRNVALSAIVIIALTPSEVTGPSFRMSFAATLALVAIYGVWTGRGGEGRMEMRRKPLWLSAASVLWTFVIGVTVTSVIGGVSTAIYSAEHFHRLSGFGLFANLAAMPVMSFIVMPAALVGMLLMPFGLDAPFISIMGYGLEIVISIAFYVASWGGDSVIGRQHMWFIAIATTGFLLLVLLRTRLRLVGVIPLVIAGGLSVFEAQKPHADILVDGDGQMVALPGNGSVAINRPRPSSFIYNQWKSALLLPEKHIGPQMIPSLPGAIVTAGADGRRPFPEKAARDASRDAMRRAVSASPDDRFICEKSIWCAARMSKGPVVAVVENSAWASSACDIADIVIVSRLAVFPTCRSGAILLDMDTLRKTGALEMTVSGQKSNPAISITPAISGKHRPWTIHRYYDWRNRNFDFTLPPPVQERLATR